MLSAQELLAVPHKLCSGDIPDMVRGFWNDTRTITAGDVFLAIRGQRDGHEFLPDAKKMGAACAVVEEIDPRVDLPQIQVEDVLGFAREVAKLHRKNYKIISVTGSYGKTSTKDMLHLLCGESAYATKENLNNLLGITISLSQLGAQPIGIIEAGIDHPGEMDPIIDLLSPDISILTGISPVHLANFLSFDQLIAEKLKIIHDGLRRGCPCIISENYRHYFSMSSLITVGKALISRGTRFEIIRDKKVRLSGEFFQDEIFSLPDMSDGQVENFAKSATVARLLGIDSNTIQERILTWRPSVLRGEWKTFAGHRVYLDAYNANPDAMLDALHYFDRTVTQPRLYVLGDMRELGTFSEREHRRVAEYFSNHLIDAIFTIGDAFAFFEKLFPKAKHFRSLPDLKEGFFSFLKSFNGSIFIKGSHAHRLWELIGN